MVRYAARSRPKWGASSNGALRFANTPYISYLKT
jgi:hypothetical protein